MLFNIFNKDTGENLSDKNEFAVTEDGDILINVKYKDDDHRTCFEWRDPFYSDHGKLEIVWTKEEE